MDLIIATHNKHKVEEIKTLLNGKFDKILSASEAGFFTDVEETGSTFFENAKLKADFLKAQLKDSNFAILSDDSGLCVNALGGQPGVNSNRLCIESDYKANRQYLLKLLEGKTDRRAKFETCVVFIYPNGTTLSATGSTTGTITTEEIGDGSFGYECVFKSDDLGITFGQATKEQKNSVSHRARALKNLCNLLENFN
ncbi:MAG: RdgB/HAM1 family non-canonical purine NTP pyrophosphatase [Clostridia bacterium]|nr:RdgB/HAM1 family non-canonical purine NTP pyrophosphatase [Clostridia bacterium]